MKKVALLISLCVGVAATSVAQEVKFGARAGLNVSTITSSYESTSESSNAHAGFHLGAVADINVYSDFLYFQPGVMLSLKGGNYEGDVKVNLTYLEVPLMLSGKYAVNGDLALRANVGPYLGLGLIGKAKSGDVKSDIFTDEGYKRFDLGLGVGAGVEYTQFYVGLGYNFGLANLSQSDDSKYKVKNGTFYISLGYNF